MARQLDPKIADGCIPWWGAVLPSGYGVVTKNRKRMRAHRFVWGECIGAIPRGNILHHKCGNKLCVNPAHLEPMSRADHNAEHGGDVTHCPKGHEYTAENTYIRLDNKRGWKTRKCRTCHRDRERARHAEYRQNT